MYTQPLITPRTKARLLSVRDIITCSGQEDVQPCDWFMFSVAVILGARAGLGGRRGESVLVQSLALARS